MRPALDPEELGWGSGRAGQGWVWSDVGGGGLRGGAEPGGGSRDLGLAGRGRAGWERKNGGRKAAGSGAWSVRVMRALGDLGASSGESRAAGEGRS